MHILGTYAEFKKFIGKSEIEEKLREAIKTYLNHGGVLKVEDSLPLKIIYPTKSKLKRELEKASQREKSLGEQVKQWNSEKNKLNASGFMINASKVINPIYWRHVAQLAYSKEYKKSFNTVEPPMEMINTPRYKKVIEMFVKNPEYRERLVEARTSVLGKMRDSIKETAYKSDLFKKQTIDNRLNKIRKERDKHTEKVKALKVILNNSNRFF